MTGVRLLDVVDEDFFDEMTVRKCCLWHRKKTWHHRQQNWQELAVIGNWFLLSQMQGLVPKMKDEKW